jgi:hypothetical protein
LPVIGVIHAKTKLLGQQEAQQTTKRPSHMLVKSEDNVGLLEALCSLAHTELDFHLQYAARYTSLEELSPVQNLRMMLTHGPRFEGTTCNVR